MVRALAPADLTASLVGSVAGSGVGHGLEALCVHGKVAAAGGAPVYQALVSCECNGGGERAQAVTTDNGAFSACTTTESRLFFGATGCECSVRAAGYRTVEDVKVDARTGQAGTILLQPLAKAEGASVKVSTLQAPPDARKEYEKGVADSRKRKWKAAGEHLAKAVALYPKYVIAWYELGQVHLARNDKEHAHLAFEQAGALSAPTSRSRRSPSRRGSGTRFSAPLVHCCASTRNLAACTRCRAPRSGSPSAESGTRARPDPGPKQGL